MKYQQEFRDPSTAKALLKAIDETVTQPWRIMEVCGGQTHSIMQYGIDTLLPAEIQLIHGPGCPVCVTPQSMIDEAIHLALAHHAIVCSYGDMLRVPGTQQSLLQELHSKKSEYDVLQRILTLTQQLLRQHTYTRSVVSSTQYMLQKFL